MKTTPNTKTLRGKALAALRSTCPHTTVIALHDGATVCIACEKVSK